jgi:DNA-binding GntR family transcriptional regulator
VNERRKASAKPAGTGAPALGLRKIVKPTVVDEFVDHLRRMIIGGDLSPGERIVEDHLSEQFGISRPPLREAMRILEQEGLVVRVARRGVTVTTMTPRDVKEIYSLRQVLERFIVELAVPRAATSDWRAVRSALDRMRQAAEAGDQVAVLDANVDFHVEVCRVAGHSRLEAAYVSLMRQMRLCMAVNLRVRSAQTGDSRESVRRHEDLLAAIESGDLASALLAQASHDGQTTVDGMAGLTGERRE